MWGIKLMVKKKSKCIKNKKIRKKNTKSDWGNTLNDIR